MSHYFDEHPAAPSEPSHVTYVVDGRELTLTTDRAVFSGRRIDPGTQVLLELAPRPPKAGNIMDLGCGYGAIATALAVQSPGATVWAVDVNARARDLCRANAATAGLSNVRVEAPSDVPDGVRFTEIWSNPPVRIGKQALHNLLGEWLPRLSSDGMAYLVVQKNLGSDSLQRWLIDSGWPTERLGSRRGFRVLRCLPAANRSAEHP